MKKILFVMLSFLVGTGAMAGEKDEYFTFNAGFLFNSTLNATLGYEHELTYGNAVELTAEIGNQWQRDPVCGKICKDVFWKGYYWDGGLLYKHCLKKFKNSNLRLRFGPEFGAFQFRSPFSSYFSTQKRPLIYLSAATALQLGSTFLHNGSTNQWSLRV